MLHDFIGKVIGSTCGLRCCCTGIFGRNSALAFFSLGSGRCRTVARSLHEHKQSKRHLYKDPEGPKVQANHNKPKTTQDTKTTRKSPSQICVSSKTKTANQTHKGARAQTKTPTKRICQGTQRTYHCVTLKNMPKLIIHHDILWNIEIEALCIASLA